MITVERLDTIEQDLKWARDNADRSAQTRLFIHHIPFLLTILRPVAEEMEAYLAEEEAYLAEEKQVETEESTEDAADSESETETVGVGARIKEFLSPSDDADADSQVDSRELADEDATDSQSDDVEATEDQAEWEETSDALENEADSDKADPEVGPVNPQDENADQDSPEATEEVTE